MLAVAVVISALVDRVRDHARTQAALEITAETERIRSALLASVSHDLRTPLAVLSGASSTLAESGERMSAEERRALATSLFRSRASCPSTSPKVLQMARLETGTIQPERDWATIGEIAARSSIGWPSGLSKHRLIVDLPDDLPLVRVDATLIEQALINLLENAAMHTPAGTVVRLRAQRRGREMLVSVEDFGGGLPDGDDRARVREVPPPFARGHRRHRTGSFDLPGDRTIARRQRVGGTGSRRRRRLPLYAADRRGASGSGGIRWPTKMTEARPVVLVVEDEPEIRRFLHAALGRGWLSRRRIGNRDTAARSMPPRTSPISPSSILASPDFDGIEVIRRIRRGPRCRSSCCRPAYRSDPRSKRSMLGLTTT
jgi:hypothetical protein